MYKEGANKLGQYLKGWVQVHVEGMIFDRLQSTFSILARAKEEKMGPRKIAGLAKWRWFFNFTHEMRSHHLRIEEVMEEVSGEKRRYQIVFSGNREISQQEQNERPAGQFWVSIWSWRSLI